LSEYPNIFFPCGKIEFEIRDIDNIASLLIHYIMSELYSTVFLPEWKSHYIRTSDIIKIVVCGEPHSGKSTFLNALHLHGSTKKSSKNPEEAIFHKAGDPQTYLISQISDYSWEDNETYEHHLRIAVISDRIPLSEKYIDNIMKFHPHMILDNVYLTTIPKEERDAKKKFLNMMKGLNTSLQIFRGNLASFHEVRELWSIIENRIINRPFKLINIC
jgi:hypothetical protein